jgi:hypothetical protein
MALRTNSDFSVDEIKRETGFVHLKYSVQGDQNVSVHLMFIL